MAKKQSSLPFDLTGCKVAELEWPKGGLSIILSGTTAGGQDVEGARVTFEKVSNLDPLYVFLMSSLKYLPANSRRAGEYLISGKPVRLPARLTCLQQSQSAKATYGNKVFTDYYGAPRCTANQCIYYFAIAAPRFNELPKFPIVCARVAWQGSDGPVVGNAETRPAPSLPLDNLELIAKEFAQAVLTNDVKLAKSLLTPAAEKRLGRSGLNKFLPRGWKSTVRELGTTDAVSLILEHLTIEPALTDDIPSESIGELAPDVDVDAILGVVTVLPGDPDWDIDPMCVLYFVDFSGEPRIGLVTS